MISSKTSLFFRQIWRSFSKSSRIFEAKPIGAGTGTVAVKNTPTQAAPAPAYAKDIILYRFESPRFYKYLSIFAVTQYGFWMFISYSCMKLLDVPVPEKAKLTPEEEKELPFWRKINLGQDKYKYGFSIGSALMGVAILFISWTYILRSLKYVVLRKDGKTISFVTYTPFGKNRIFDTPLKHVSAVGSRTSGSTQMPVKVKGKSLFYLLDLKEGKFPQPQLFDKTVGTKRKLV